jgi:hypothetical protein
MDESEKRRSEVALAFFNHVESQVGLATNTTSLLIAANAFLLAAYLTLLKDFAEKVPAGAVQTWHGIVGLALMLLTAASACSLWAVFPTRRARPVEPDRKNLVFFGHVASFGSNCEEYVKQFTHASPDELLKDVLAQAHAKSYYLARMFHWLQFGVALTIASLLTFAVAAMLVIGAKMVG